MNFEINKKDNVSVITCLIEKLDTLVAPELKSQFVLLDSNGESNFIIDMSSVKYCDSSGLSALLVGNRFAKSSKGSFVIGSSGVVIVIVPVFTHVIVGGT